MSQHFVAVICVLWTCFTNNNNFSMVKRVKEVRPSPGGGVESWGPPVVQSARVLCRVGAPRCAGWCRAAAPETWRHSAVLPPRGAAALHTQIQTIKCNQLNKGFNTIHLLVIKPFLPLIGSDPNCGEMTQSKQWRFFSLPVLTSPWWPHEVCGVINDELEIIQQQDVYTCGGGDPRSIWIERETNGKGGGKRDAALIGSHYKDPWHLLIIRLVAAWLSWEVKSRCTYTPRVSFQAPVVPV